MNIKPRIVCVTGLKRSGKDTIANYLVNQYEFRRYAFADPMKEIAKLIFRWTDNHVNGDLKEIVDERWGISPRQFLQLFGTELMQIRLSELVPDFQEKTGRKVWVKGFVEDYKQKLSEGDIRNVVISDLRFPHEIQEIENSLPDVEKIYIRVDRGLPKTDLHESEIFIPELKVDYEVPNKESLSRLYERIDKILKEEILKGL